MALLPPVLRANRRAVSDPALARRLDQVGHWIGDAFGQPYATLDNACNLLADWSRQAGLKRLADLGIGTDARSGAAEAAATSSSMKANPALLTTKTLRAIMAEA